MAFGAPVCYTIFMHLSWWEKKKRHLHRVTKKLGPRPNEDRQILTLITLHANAGSLCPVDQDNQTHGCNELKKETSLLTLLIQEIFIDVVKKLCIFIMIKVFRCFKKHFFGGFTELEIYENFIVLHFSKVNIKDLKLACIWDLRLLHVKIPSSINLRTFLLLGMFREI